MKKNNFRLLLAATSALALINTNAYGENRFTNPIDLSMSSTARANDWQGGVAPVKGDHMTITGDHGLTIDSRGDFGNIYLNDHNVTILIKPGGDRVSFNSIVDNTHNSGNADGYKEANIIFQDDAPATLAFTGQDISSIRSILVNTNKDDQGYPMNNYDHVIEFNGGLFSGKILDLSDRMQTTVIVKQDTIFTGLIGAYFDKKGDIINARLSSLTIDDNTKAEILSEKLHSMEIKLNGPTSALKLTSTFNNITIDSPIKVSNDDEGVIQIKQDVNNNRLITFKQQVGDQNNRFGLLHINNVQAKSEVIFEEPVFAKYITVANGTTEFKQRVNMMLSDKSGIVLNQGILTFNSKNGKVIFKDKFYGDITIADNKKGTVEFHGDSDIFQIGAPDHALNRLVFKNAKSFNLFNDIHAKRIKFDNGNFEIKNNLSINGNKISFDASHLILNNNQLTVASSGRNNVIDFNGNINVDVNPTNGKLILDGNVNYKAGTNLTFNLTRIGAVGENFHLAKIFDDTKILQDNGAPIFDIAGNGWVFDKNTYIVTSTALANNDNNGNPPPQNNNNGNPPPQNNNNGNPPPQNNNNGNPPPQNNNNGNPPPQNNNNGNPPPQNNNNGNPPPQNNNNGNPPPQQQQQGNQQQAQAAVTQAKAAVQKAATGSPAAKAAAQTALNKASAQLKAITPVAIPSQNMVKAVEQALSSIKNNSASSTAAKAYTVASIMTKNGIINEKQAVTRIREIHQEAIIEHVLGADKNKNTTSVNVELKTLVASDVKAHIKTIVNDAAKNIHKASEAAQNFDAISINLNIIAKNATSDEGVKGKSNEQQAMQYIAHLQQLGSEQQRAEDIAKTKSQGVDHINVGNEAGQLVKNTVSDRLDIVAAAAGDSIVTFSPWISTSMSSGSQQKLYNGSNVAITAGVDMGNNDGKSFGLAYSNVNGSFKYKGNRSGDKLRANLHVGSLYGQIDNSSIVWQGSASYITGNIKGKNNILEAKGKNKSASVGYKTNGFTVDNNIGFKIASGDLTFIPNVGLSYSSYKDSARDVKGAGVKRLATQAIHTNALVGSAGVRVMMPQKLSDNLTITPTLMASVDNNFSHNDKVKAKLIWQQDYFDVKAGSSKKSKIGYYAGAGFIVESNNLEITASYKCRAQKQYQAHQGGIKLKVSL